MNIHDKYKAGELTVAVFLDAGYTIEAGDKVLIDSLISVVSGTDLGRLNRKALLSYKAFALKSAQLDKEIEDMSNEYVKVGDSLIEKIKFLSDPESEAYVMVNVLSYKPAKSLEKWYVGQIDSTDFYRKVTKEEVREREIAELAVKVREIAYGLSAERGAKVVAAYILDNFTRNESK